MHRPPLPPRKIPVLISVKGWVDPRPSVTGSQWKMRDPIGNPTRDLPACSAVTQPNAPPRHWTNFVIKCYFVYSIKHLLERGHKRHKKRATCNIWKAHVIKWVALRMSLASKSLNNGHSCEKCYWQNVWMVSYSLKRVLTFTCLKRVKNTTFESYRFKRFSRLVKSDLWGCSKNVLSEFYFVILDSCFISQTKWCLWKLETRIWILLNYGK